MNSFRKSAIVVLLAVSLVAGLATVTNANDEWPEWEVILVAHRGLAPGFPENTLAAFENVLVELGATIIEVDLRGTKDGVPIIIHDSTVDRTTDGHGKVGDLTLDQIKQLDAGSYVGPEFAGAQVPTFRETLELVTSLGGKLLLDIKESPTLDREKVVRLVEEFGAVLDVIVGARTVEDVKLFRSLNPNIRILGFIPSTRYIEDFLAAGCDIIRLWPKWIFPDPRLVAQVYDLGKPVWTTAGTANREELSQLIKLGVNGILTDLPELLSTLLSDIRVERGGF